MIINGTLIISKYPPSRVGRDIIWIDISNHIPKIKHFTGNGWVILNDIPEIPTPPTWNTLEGKPEVIASGETQEEARNSIGAGTGNSNLVLGTTATTAKAGNYQPTWAQVTSKPTTFTPSEHTHAWADITAKPAIIASGATQAEARTAIGAGTGNSNLEIGTTASTAKAGNYQPTWAQVTGKPSTFAPEIGDTASTAAAGNHDHAVTAHVDSGLDAASNIQALAQALSTRIKILEDAQPTP